MTIRFSTIESAIASAQEDGRKADRRTSMPKLTRRSVLAGSTAMAALAAAGPAQAQAKPKMRFSSAFTENDLRTEAYKGFAAAMADVFEFEPYYGNTLFKQG